MKEVPRHLLESVPEADRATVVRWWAEVPERDRQEVARLYDPLVEDSFFEPSELENSVLLATHFRGGSWLLGDGILTISTDWGRTGFKAAELPPSAQR